MALVKTGATYNSAQAAEAYDMAAADADISGAFATTLKEATSPAEHSDHAATSCTDADFVVYIHPTPAATSVPEKTQKERRET